MMKPKKMKIYKTTTWKWWELKILGIGIVAIVLGLALTFPDAIQYLAKYTIVVWILAAILYGYSIIAYIKK